MAQTTAASIKPPIRTMSTGRPRRPCRASEPVAFACGGVVGRWPGRRDGSLLTTVFSPLFELTIGCISTHACKNQEGDVGANALLTQQSGEHGHGRSACRHGCVGGTTPLLFTLAGFHRNLVGTQHHQP